MNDKTTLLLFISLFFYANAFAQAKYFKDQNGKVIDEVSYQKQKEERSAKFKAKFPKAIVSEETNELHKTSDSIIYSYKVFIRTPDEEEKKGFDADNYVGREFPLSGLMTIDNEPVAIDKLKGKPTLINFWYTACKPCIEEMPVLNELRSHYAESVNFIAVTFESKEKVKAFLRKQQFDFIQVAGARKFIDNLKMTAFPTNIFLDKNGNVVSVENGIPYNLGEDKVLRMGDSKDFEAKLRKLL